MHVCMYVYERVYVSMYVKSVFTYIREVYVYIVWVWNLVADIAGGKEAEGVWKHGVEENIWNWEGRGNGGMEEIA